MNESAIYQLLLAQQKQIRELKLHLEALKRMMFEHRHRLSRRLNTNSRQCEHRTSLRMWTKILKDCSGE
jgi:hypothetical protein